MREIIALLRYKLGLHLLLTPQIWFNPSNIPLKNIDGDSILYIGLIASYKSFGIIIRFVYLFAEDKLTALVMQ